MTDSSSMTNHVGCYIARTVLGRSGKGFQREVERFLIKNGIEWTNNRLKAIWTAANHLRNGDRKSAIQIYQANSISYHKSDGTPKGPFRPAVRSYVLAQRAPRIRAHAAVLRFYCGLRLKKLSEQQSKKAYEAITELPPRYISALDNGNVDECLKHDRLIQKLASYDLRKGGLRVLTRLAEKVDSGVVHQNYEPPIRDRYADGLRPTTYCYSRHRLPKGISCRDPYMSMALSFMTEPWCPASIDRLTPCYEMRELVRSQGFDNQEFVGKIGVIQEQGCKARVVAMPSAWLQLAFLPMHTRLDKLNQYLDCSCVKDQLKGAYAVWAHMCDGKNAYGVDLSSATDRFPRSYSIQILKDIGMGNYADALEELCSQPWDSPWGPVKYATGQPMGLYGSFPLFNMSHAVFAAARCREVEEEVHKASSERVETRPLDYFHTGLPFYVLGDDVVFSDIRFASRYKRGLELLEIPVSHHKSFGGQVCEFAGFLVIRNDSGNCTAFRPYKVPDQSYITNPIQALHSVGQDLSRTSSYWRRKFEEYRVYQSHRALDLTPLVREERRRGANPYRGDTLTVKNACQHLSMLYDAHALPDLSGDTKINTIPLFAERGMFDFYGFSPDELRISEEELRQSAWEPYRVRQLYKDPLMKKASDEASEKIANSLSSLSTSEASASEISYSQVDQNFSISLPILTKEFGKELHDVADGCTMIPNFPLFATAPPGAELKRDWAEYSLRERFRVWKDTCSEQAWTKAPEDLRLLLVQRGFGLCKNERLKGKSPVGGDFPLLGVRRSSTEKARSRGKQTSPDPPDDKSKSRGRGR